MIKHFNTALGSAAGNASASKGKGGNALIWVLGLGVLVFVGYKFIESRNRIVTQQND
jgi:hypothetical protein